MIYPRNLFVANVFISRTPRRGEREEIDLLVHQLVIADSTEEQPNTDVYRKGLVVTHRLNVRGKMVAK